MKYLLFFLSLLQGLTGIAQNRVFMGRVVDKHNKGIPFAVVSVKEQNRGVYCDENGAFAFTANAEEIKTLVVSCLGFEQKEISTDIIPLDSVIISLQTRVATLREVSIIGSKGKTAVGTLGKSRKHLSYEGDCYRYYGSETAIRLKADTAKGGTLKEVYVYITDEGAPTTKFRVHLYEWGRLPDRELTDSNIIVQAKKGKSWVRIDVSNLHIPVGKGVFVSVEWISGFGNSQMAMVSEKNPEVNNYNGQVLGLTSDYGKPSRTYSRQPFEKKWIYYDAPEAQRRGGYFLNPMIYCTFTYLK
jgi:hypothetical protein